MTVTEQLRATVHAAQMCWEDTSRWSAWIDGLDQVTEVSGEWPAAGSCVRWESGPAGRGAVTEQVTAREPLLGMTSDVADDTLRGVQTVSFEPVADGVVLVTLSLNYRILRRTLLTPVVDALFVRRAMRMSLRGTLERFGAELTSGRREN